MERREREADNGGIMNQENLERKLSAGSPNRSGTQSLGRGIRLMRMIASKPDFGWRLSDLSAACQQDKATVHRMLTCLVQERLVERRAHDRHYVPGPLMYELGLAQRPRVQFHRYADAALQEFARQQGGIALFLLRSGNEYVCSLRAGTLTLTGLMVHPGTRRPLFTSVGGIAILQKLPKEEARQVLLSNISQEISFRGSGRLDALQKMRERSDRHGFGVNLGDVVSGVHAFAVPVMDSGGQPFAALCLMGSPEQYSEEHLPHLHDQLKTLAGTLAARARALGL